MEKKNEHIIRIALIGPECSGKSTLAEELAQHYNTVWVPEYSREYLAEINRKYTSEDILFIAQEQLKREKEKLKKANTLLFADTEIILSKVWSIDVFKTCPDWIMENILPRYDLYLLTYPDIDWHDDPLRENKDRREFFFNWYRKELELINARYAVIRGSGEERFRNAKQEVDNFIANLKN